MDEMNNSPYPAGGPAGAPAKTPGMAVASLVLGIVAIVLSCCLYYISMPCAILAIVFGILTMRKGPAGKGMCIAGIVCGALSLVLSVVFLVLVGASAAALLAEYPELQRYL